MGLLCVVHFLKVLEDERLESSSFDNAMIMTVMMLMMILMVMVLVVHVDDGDDD